MSLKQFGGVFGRNPTFNDVTIEGELILNGNTFTGLDYQGTWNASTNTPALTGGSGTTGEFYIVNVAGATDLDGITNWAVGDWAMFNGSAWQRLEGGANGNFVDLSASGNVTLGDASTDNVTVNGYMGVGGAGASNAGLNLVNAALTGSIQYGLVVNPTASSAAGNISAIYAGPKTAAATFAVNTVSAVEVANAVKGAGSTITNQHGVYISDQTQGTNNYGITSLVSSGSNKWNIYASGTAANYFAGNVGIGTSSPAIGKLHLVQTSDTSIGGIGVASSSGISARLYVDSSNIRHLTAGSTDVINWDSSGNIGLGVTPSAWAVSFNAIDLNNTGASIAGGVNILQATTNSYYNGTNWIYKATNSAAKYTQNTGVHSWDTAPSGTAGNAITFTERLSVGLTEMVVNDPGNDYDFRVESDTNTHALFVQGSDGNVGIGSNNPLKNLHIVQAASGGTPSSLSNAVIENNNDTGLGILTPATSTGWITFGDNSNGSVGRVGYNHANDALVLYTASTERLRIDSSGNVGIGTSSPSENLEVSGANPTVKVTSTTDDWAAFDNQAGDTQSNYIFFRDAAAERARITVLNSEDMTFSTGSSPVERLKLDATATVFNEPGADVDFRVESDTNTHALFVDGGTDSVRAGKPSLATTATDGFLYIPTCAGTPTGTPSTISGMSPLVVDTTNNKLYFYSGGQWRDAGP